ncbi:MAG TPA: VOC family protein [Ktedonobacteraceae bacterium]
METSQKRIHFTGGHPILNVKNVDVSLDYYCSKLGFKRDFSWPPHCEARGQTVPTFAQVSRGNFSVMLAQEEQGGPAMWIYLDLASLDDLAALYQEYLANAVKIAEPPTDQPWDMREMLVEDVDGHVLRIGAPHPHE